MPQSNIRGRPDSIGEADQVNYKPTTPADWTNPDPHTVQQGLDDLAAAPGGGLNNIVEDLTPQLGGDLDVNDKKIVAGASTNIILQLGSTGSSTFFVLKDSNAVTQFTINGDGTLNVTGNIITSALIDGRDVAVDGTKLDTIATNANNYSHPDHTGDVTSTGDGATAIGTDKVVTAKILDSNVTLAKLADLVQDRIMGRATASTGAPEAITAQQVLAMINSAATGTLKHERGGIEADISGAAIGQMVGAAAADTLSLLSPVYAIVREATTALTVNNATWTSASYDTELHDTDNIWTSGAATRFTPSTKGIYLFFGGGQVAEHITGQRHCRFLFNGTTNVCRSLSDTNRSPCREIPISTFIEMNGTTDYMEMQFWQNSGGSLTITVVDRHSLVFGCFLLART